MARKSTGKRLRFEIFKRDGFRCLYCGATPVEKALRADHVIPVAQGGPTEAENLVTSCFDCNAGKAAVPLEERALVSSIAAEADREHAEQIFEWLRIQREIRSAKDAVVDDLCQLWSREIGYRPVDLLSRLRAAVDREGYAAVQKAIERTGRKDLPSVTTQFQYFYGVLRGIRSDREKA